MHLAQPLWLLLWLLIPLLIWRHRRTRTRQHPVFHLSQPLPGQGGRTWRVHVHRALPVLRWLAIAALVVAMARPQRHWLEQKIKADAVDIVLALDVSLSMLSRGDFDPDRLTAAKQVAAEFVKNRPYDRIGLVAFAAEAFTQCPVTTDKDMVQYFLKELRVGVLEHGTAIGMGLATAVNRLQDSPARSKVVILLTDGENTTGYIPPLKAAEMAQSLGIRVYTIGIGSEKTVMTPQDVNPDGSYLFKPRRTVFDTKMLQEMARITQGKFYRAESLQDLGAIYQTIDALEKTRLDYQDKYHTEELYIWPAGLAIALLLLELLLRYTVLRAVTI